MSIEKYALVQNIFDALILAWQVKGYKGLAGHIGVPYQTLMAWKKRGSIGDYASFMDKGISKAWLETGEGEMFATLDPYPKGLKKFQEFSRQAQTVMAESNAAAMLPNPDRMTIEQKLNWVGLKTKDIRQIQEWMKLSEEEQDAELKRLCMQNIEKGRY